MATTTTSITSTTTLLVLLLWLHVSPSDLAADGLPPLVFEDFVTAVAAKEGWDHQAVRVSKTYGGKAKVGRSRKYDLHLRVADRVWVLKVSDSIGAWQAVKGEERDGRLFIGNYRRRREALEAFELEGPLELRTVEGGEMSLRLPANSMHGGIKKAIIGEGIKIKIKRAAEVSMFIPNDLRLLINGSLVASNKYKHRLWPQEYPSCRQLLTVLFRGLAVVKAYSIYNSKASIRTAFHSPDTLELLPEKCFRHGYFRQRSPVNVLSLSSQFGLVDKLLRSFLGNKIIKLDIPHFIKVKITSASLIRFWMEVEKKIDYGDPKQKKLAEWKTAPLLERAQFEIIARLEGSKQLKPVSIKKLKKPVTVAEVMTWNSLMSNISLSKFLSNIVSPEPLTLDVK